MWCSVLIYIKLASLISLGIFYHKMATSSIQKSYMTLSSLETFSEVTSNCLRLLALVLILVSFLGICLSKYGLVLNQELVKNKV